MVSSESFGIMNKAYQVPKAVILEWLNDLLGVSNIPYSKFSGSFVCKRLKSVRRLQFTAE